MSSTGKGPHGRNPCLCPVRNGVQGIAEVGSPSVLGGLFATHFIQPSCTMFTSHSHPTAWLAAFGGTESRRQKFETGLWANTRLTMLLITYFMKTPPSLGCSANSGLHRLVCLRSSKQKQWFSLSKLLKCSTNTAQHSHRNSRDRAVTRGAGHAFVCVS